MNRWSLEDNTESNKGFCRILLDGMDVGIDVFPFRKGADAGAVKKKAAAVIEVLNAAEAWRGTGEGADEVRLEDAVDALTEMNVPNMSEAS